jgi:type I restriction-modification system DNA methylase subunit
MALFQTSVLKSHLALLDEAAVDKAYKKYQKYFWNTTIQENIKSAKEEQYQATFLNELFVNILGYTLFPNPNSNLTTEFKNEKNARKADGAILKDGAAIGVIELKGTNTKDLESIRRQAFDYKANQKGCVYVVTSNFEKLRFYINDATEFEEFDLFTLSRKRFNLLYLCLHLDKVLNNTPLKIKEASIVEEEEITKAFYKDYSIFKRELYRDLVKRNSKTVKDKLATTERDEDITRLEKNVKLTLFQKSQKLIDRFLFIFFAEDRMLLPSNSTLQILNKWKDDWDFGDERPLYGLFKQYFNFLDIGRKGTEKRAEIYAYNGGLFKPDAILDALEIDNDLLYKYTLKLSNYDFESQVDVNILGHIFENSLNEIESVNAEIEGGEFDKQTSKRKKDGVFYTPKYITKYIVENTVGKLCDDKKQELGFDEEQYFKGRKNRNKTTIEKLVSILDTYREWLLQITICDPACGSGAFLNQALDFLIKEHNYIDELKVRVLGGGLQFPDIENTILENNIYGVDLNEESVEIAKLSLWLRTAQPRRKLNDLSSNIKCGNSLIDNKSVAGDKAFKWETAFAKVFENGGFDVIIGNPPYGAQITKNDQKFYLSKYTTPSYKLDTYSIFIEKAFELLKKDGFVCYIVPYTWLTINQHQKLREFILQFNLQEVINLPQKVFDDADLDTVIVNIQKRISSSSFQFGGIKERQVVIDGTLDLDRIKKSSDKLINLSVSESDIQILEKVQSLDRLEKFFEVSQGYIPYRRSDLVKTYGKEEGNAIVDGRLWHSDTKHSQEWKQEIQGRDLSRYSNRESYQYIKYGKHLAGYVDEKFFNQPRILIMEVTRGAFYKISSTYVEKEFYNTPSIINIIHPDSNVNLIKSLCAIINSRLITWYHLKVNPKANAVTSIPKILIKDVRRIPIPENYSSLEALAKKRLEQGNSQSSLQSNFLNYITKSLSLKKVSRKLENWEDLTFKGLIAEIKKAIKATNKIKEDGENDIPHLTKKDEFEWMELFEENKQKAVALQTQIANTEKEIDQKVYELYGLTEDEIAIVENS